MSTIEHLGTLHFSQETGQDCLFRAAQPVRRNWLKISINIFYTVQAAAATTSDQIVRYPPCMYIMYSLSNE